MQQGGEEGEELRVRGLAGVAEEEEVGGVDGEGEGGVGGRWEGGFEV